MGPGQPGTQPTETTPSSTPEETIDPPLPTVGPHAAVSSSSAFNTFAPFATDNADAQLIQGVQPADLNRIWQRLEDLRETTNGILTGVTNFYNKANFTAARNREGDPPICDEETLNAAFRIVLIALDSGFPPAAEALNPPLLGDQCWLRAACAILAAVGRGMIRTTPDHLKTGAAKPLDPEVSFFKLAPEILPPKSDGELLQCLAEHVAGMINFRNDLNLDANPYSYFDAIKERARPLLEEGANLQAQSEAETWRIQLTNRLKSAGFDDTLRDLEKELSENMWLSNRQEVLAKELILQVGTLRNHVLGEARAAARRDSTGAMKAEAEKERDLIYKEELECVKRDVSREVNQEVRNWRISYREKREQEFQTALDAEVKAANTLAVIKAARDLGMSPADFRNAPGSEKPHKPGPPTSMGPPPAKAGSKRTASGNLPPRCSTPAPAAAMEVVPEEGGPSRRTRSRSRTPTGPRAPAPPEILQPVPRRGPQPAPAPVERAHTPFVSGVASSMHNPANAMAIDMSTANPALPQTQPGEGPPSTTPQEDPNAGPLVAIQNMLTTLAARVEQVAAMVEGPNNRTHPSRGEVSTAAQATPPAAPPGPPPGNRPPRVDIPRQSNPDDGFIQMEPPRRAWNNVTAHGIAQQVEARATATKSAAAQGKTQSGRPATRNPTAKRLPSNTEVTVLRDGGLSALEAEAAVRAQRPDNIVREVQKQINAQVKNNPIQILAGRWSGSVKRTGNFIFTIRGQVNFPLIASYSRFLLAPFPGSELAPSGNWTWAQLRGVPIWDENDIAHSQEELMKALRANPAFEEAIITTVPRWQIPIERLSGDAGTVVFSYCDPDESITRQAREDHIFLFGSYAKFTISPSRPALIQCSRCHQLGHARNSRACRVPAEALICFKCGGPHRSEHHSRECRRVHRDVGICDCPLKCILCGDNGHHARDSKCPKRTEFAPPRASNRPQQVSKRQDHAADNMEGWTTVGGRKRSRVPARPAYRGAGGGKGKQPPPPSPTADQARFDDAASEAQVEQTLWHDLNDFDDDYTPGQGWDNVGDDNLSLNGTRQASRPVPRNATPGPSSNA